MMMIDTLSKNMNNSLLKALNQNQRWPTFSEQLTILSDAFSWLSTHSNLPLIENYKISSDLEEKLNIS